MSQETGEPPKFDWREFTPEDSPKTPMDIKADPLLQDLGAAKLAHNDPAFDIEQPIYDFSDGTERITGENFHLRKLAEERPVALIFGSYT